MQSVILLRLRKIVWLQLLWRMCQCPMCAAARSVPLMRIRRDAMLLYAGCTQEGLTADVHAPPWCCPIGPTKRCTADSVFPDPHILDCL